MDCLYCSYNYSLMLIQLTLRKLAEASDGRYHVYSSGAEVRITL